jgi:integrase
MPQVISQHIAPVALSNSSTISTQVAWYLNHLENRNRRRAKPATIATYRSFARNHVLPILGEMKMENFTNGPMKKFVAHLNAKELSPKSVKEISSFVRPVISSAVDDEGSKLYVQNWNHDFIDAIPVRMQLQPITSKQQLQQVLNNQTIKVRDRVFLALAASTGLRLGEISALKIGDDGTEQDSAWYAADTVIRIRKSVWRGRLQMPKTAAAIRNVDLSHAVNHMLQEFTRGRSSFEFLFTTKYAKPLDPKYIRKYILQPNAIVGAHALRRLRVSHLREVGCNEDILRAWIGHGQGSDVTNRYSKLTENLELRRALAEKVGTGLDLTLATVSKTGEFVAQRMAAAGAL